MSVWYAPVLLGQPATRAAPFTCCTQPYDPNNAPPSASHRPSFTNPSLDKINSEAKLLCKNLEEKEAEFRQALNQKTIHANWQELREIYYELFELYEDLIMFLIYPGVSSRFHISHFSIPERMWSHGIQPMLELLQLPGPRTSNFFQPENSDHLAAFFRVAYCTLVAFSELETENRGTCMEYLANLCKYRMMSGKDSEMKAMWGEASLLWYARASMEDPLAGSLYYNLSQIDASNPLRQLYLLTLSLLCDKPYKERSCTAILDLSPEEKTAASCFMHIHQIQVQGQERDKFQSLSQAFLDSLNNHIAFMHVAWKEEGTYIAVVNIVGLLYALSQQTRTYAHIHDARNFLFSVFSITLQRLRDPNVLPYVYITFEFLYYLAAHNFDVLLSYVPWELIVIFLNSLWNMTGVSNCQDVLVNYPLPEDYTLRAMAWCWSDVDRPWSFEPVDTEPPGLTEPIYTTDIRRRRILSLGVLIASRSYWIGYTETTGFLFASDQEAHIAGIVSLLQLKGAG